MIIHRAILDYNTHCKHYTGEYVLAHDDQHIKNNMNARAIDCIYLRPSIQSKNIHEFYNINTKQIITRRHYTSVPIPTNIIKQIENQALEENMPTAINFNPEYIGNDIQFAGMEKDSDEEEEISDTNQNQNNDQNIEQEMDINDLHEIVHDPHNFHIPNTKHKPSI